MEYIDLYRNFSETIKKHSPELLNKRRDEAFADFVRLGFPTSKLENYKYTNLAEAYKIDFGLNINRLAVSTNPYAEFRCDVPNIGSHLFFVVNDTFVAPLNPPSRGDFEGGTAATPPLEGGQGGAVILVNGNFPTNAIPLNILQNANYIVCCDGAADKLLQNTDKIPDAIVGDCDSISTESKTRFADRIHCISEQETNDLTKAVHFCVKNGKKEIIILGATGKREDHTLGNISLLAEYIDIEGINISMATDYGIFTAIKKTTVFESYKGQQISIFDIGHTPTTFHNLKYPVENRVLENWWQGTLNEALSDSFTIETQGKMIVFCEW